MGYYRNLFTCKIINLFNSKNILNEMKKTIEEAANDHANQFIDGREHYYGFIAGAKYQSEQMYSHEEVNQYILDVMSGLLVLTIKEWKESKK